MIKSLVIIVVIGVTSFIYTDMQSPSVFYSGVFPFIVFFSLIALGVWFVMLFHKLGIKQTSNSSSGGFWGGDGGGGSDGA